MRTRVYVKPESITPIDHSIERLKQLNHMATSGPWTWELGLSGDNWPICNVGAGGDGTNHWVTTDNVRASQTNSHGPQCDAEFIALARTLMPLLLEAWDQQAAEKKASA